MLRLLRPGSAAGAAAGSKSFLYTLPAGPQDHRFAWILIGISVLVFVAVAPFARTPLVPVPAFIPLYQSALIVNDIVTAILLFGQFRIARSRALLVLANGYLFTAMLTAVHTATFPGLFAPGGLLGAGPQSTAWIYMFWHAGFPLFVVAYALLGRNGDGEPLRGRPRTLIGASAAATGTLALALAALATGGHDALPPIMQGNRYTPLMAGVVTTVWACSIAPLVLLWRRRSRSVLDLWLAVVMCAWLCEIALSAVLNAGRFDLGFYAGRVYGLFAASFVLLALLLENSSLYAELVSAHERERDKADDAQRLSVQLADANLELAGKNQQLEQASRLKSEFLSNMSHELRTPLNAIIGFSEMMKEGLTGELNARQREFIGHVFNSGQHLLAMINDILDLSKIEAGRAEIDVARVDVDQLLGDAVTLFSERATPRQVRLRREPGAAIGTIEADRRRLRQIVDNLLSNALKFTPAGGEVALRASLVGRARAANGLPGFRHGVRMPLPDNDFDTFVEISVTDTGIGIPAEEAGRLFTPFTQIANPLTRSLQGTGLGLAMVRQLAELHGGTVAVTSEPNRGSCFTVWLPTRTRTASETTAARPAAAATGRTTPASASPLALVIEDDDKAAELMRVQLEAQGFRVRHVPSAEAAFAVSGEVTPDVITLDILLPGMDGWEFLARVKDVPAWRDVPVVVVSVVADEGKGVSLGASLVLQKPIARDELARGLARLGVTPNRATGATALVVDDDPKVVDEIAAELNQAGHVVLRAHGGREGIRLARRFQPDLILLDLEMPDVSGFDVVEALKSNPSTAQIPIAAITGRPPEGLERLNERIGSIVRKAEFNHGRFIGEVQRAMGRLAP